MNRHRPETAADRLFWSMLLLPDWSALVTPAAIAKKGDEERLHISRTFRPDTRLRERIAAEIGSGSSFPRPDRDRGSGLAKAGIALLIARQGHP